MNLNFHGCRGVEEGVCCSRRRRNEDSHRSVKMLSPGGETPNTRDCLSLACGTRRYCEGLPEGRQTDSCAVKSSRGIDLVKINQAGAVDCV